MGDLSSRPAGPPLSHLFPVNGLLLQGVVLWAVAEDRTQRGPEGGHQPAVRVDFHMGCPRLPGLCGWRQPLGAIPNGGAGWLAECKDA